MRPLALAVLFAAGCGRVGFDATSADATADAAAPLECAGTAACYAFDGDLTDVSGNANHVVQLGAMFTPGLRGEALLLPGSGKAMAAESSTLTIGDVVTVEAIVRLDNLPPVFTRSVILDHDSSYIMYVAPDGHLHGAIHNGSTSRDVEGSRTLSIGEWHRLAMTYDGAAHTVWVDGSAIGTAPLTGPIEPDSAAGMRIGGNITDALHPDEDPLSGAIDSLRIWHRALSASELQ